MGHLWGHQYDAASPTRPSLFALGVSELVTLKWAQIDLNQGRLAVVRAKTAPGYPPPRADPKYALWGAQDARSETVRTSFVTECKDPLTASWGATRSGA